MQEIRQRIETVRARQQRLWIIRCVGWGTLFSGIAGCLLGGLMIAQLVPIQWTVLAIVLAIGPGLGLIIASVFSRPVAAAALAIDEKYHLKDRSLTALSFQALPQRTALQELQLADAQSYLSQVDPKEVIPWKTPGSLSFGVACSLIAVSLTFLVPQAVVVQASTTVNPVVNEQALRLEEEVKKLEEFNNESPDPQLEKLMKVLATKVEELQQPGLDPKEALAKLSEIQAALEAKQTELSDPSAQAELKEIGETLSLAESLQAAGNALSKGDLDKASEELQKLEDLPKLDKQTERAVTEKLDQQSAAPANGARRQVKDAASQISAGLSQGNKSKFQDGLKSLAGEAKKQSRKNKLADLLRKQCQCLSECKSECESECMQKNISKTAKKGGKKAGTAASGNTAGEKTAQLNSNQKMQITGQESAEGEVETETLTDTDKQQTATREYRAKIDKYQQLNESVLDSEPIPLGHRQTIRRYFEMIRPQNTETDSIQEKLGQ